MSKKWSKVRIVGPEYDEETTSASSNPNPNPNLNSNPSTSAETTSNSLKQGGGNEVSAASKESNLKKTAKEFVPKVATTPIIEVVQQAKVVNKFGVQGFSKDDKKLFHKYNEQRDLPNAPRAQQKNGWVPGAVGCPCCDGFPSRCDCLDGNKRCIYCGPDKRPFEAVGCSCCNGFPFSCNCFSSNSNRCLYCGPERIPFDKQYSSTSFSSSQPNLTTDATSPSTVFNMQAMGQAITSASATSGVSLSQKQGGGGEGPTSKDSSLSLAAQEFVPKGTSNVGGNSEPVDIRYKIMCEYSTNNNIAFEGDILFDSRKQNCYCCRGCVFNCSCNSWGYGIDHPEDGFNFYECQMQNCLEMAFRMEDVEANVLDDAEGDDVDGDGEDDDDDDDVYTDVSSVVSSDASLFSQGGGATNFIGQEGPEAYYGTSATCGCCKGYPYQCECLKTAWNKYCQRCEKREWDI